MENNNKISFKDFMKKIKKDKVIKYDNITVAALPISSRKDKIPNGVMINIMPIVNKNNIDRYSIVIGRDFVDEPFSITRIMNINGTEMEELNTETDEFYLPKLISFISSANTDLYDDISNAIYKFFNLDYKDYNKISLIPSCPDMLFNFYINSLEEILENVKQYKGELNIEHATGETDTADIFMSSISPLINDINYNSLNVSFRITKWHNSDIIEFSKLTSVGVHENRYLDCYKLVLGKASKRAETLFKLLKKYDIYDKEDIDSIVK